MEPQQKASSCCRDIFWVMLYKLTLRKVLVNKPNSFFIEN